MKKYFVTILLALTSGSSCTNIGLLDQLENPGGKESFTSNYYVFVSSWSTMGDMAGGPNQQCNSQFTGPERADCACTRAAAANGLRKHANHRFGAYLGLTGANIEARCRIAGLASACAPNIPGPWLNTVGTVVINAFMPVGGVIDNPILFTENRVALTAADRVWTGAGATGNHLNECAGWNDTTGVNVNVGDPTLASSTWQNATIAGCNSLNRLYCFATP